MHVAERRKDIVIMKKISTILLCAGISIVPGMAAGQEQETPPSDPPHADLIGTDGEVIGTAVFVETPNGLMISVAVEGLPAGEHGFHIHSKGICDPAEGFKTAGGHFAPRGHQHGLKLAEGPHAGDMPNQFVGSDGVLRATVFNDRVTLGEGFNSLTDEDGSALVIHAGPDDYKSQPTGDAGGRLACAVISPPKPM